MSPEQRIHTIEGSILEAREQVNAAMRQGLGDVDFDAVSWGQVGLKLREAYMYMRTIREEFERARA